MNETLGDAMNELAVTTIVATIAMFDFSAGMWELKAAERNISPEQRCAWLAKARRDRDDAERVRRGKRFLRRREGER